MEFFATCARGLEDLLVAELSSLNLPSVRKQRGGVVFKGNQKDAYRACLWSRIASRVLLTLDRISAADADDLYENLRVIPWSDHIPVDATIAVHATGTNRKLRNTQFLAMRTKDAIVDSLFDEYKTRPSVDRLHPDITIVIKLKDTKAIVSLDLSGEALHIREYRVNAGRHKAPIRETLAAAVLAAGGWYREIRNPIPVCIDPLCGSGTIAIEAAMQALDRAPGLLRSRWGFTKWAQYDENTWYDLLDEADARAEDAMNRKAFILAGDIDKNAIELTKENAKRAGVLHALTFHEGDISSIDIDAIPCTSGLLATNPPYAERMSSIAQLPSIYAALASIMHQRSEFKASIITPDKFVDTTMGSAPSHVLSVMNGPLKSSIRVFDSIPEAQGNSPGHNDVIKLSNGKEVPVLVKESDQFAARLQKMYKHRSKWARRSNVTCYRLYDADLPDYNVSIDYFQGTKKYDGKSFLQVVEYAPSKKIDEDKSKARLVDILSIASSICSVNSINIFLKREADKGKVKSVDKKGESRKALVSENDFIFEVNFTDHFDVGLPLEYRDIRKLIGEKSNDKRFLNLFAGAGCATCYAASGGAFETTTVDFSKSYVNWSRRNMKHNNFCGKDHIFIEADVPTWIYEQRHSKNRWDLVFCNPPTFFSSQDMKRKSFDLQRDHVELFIDISRILTKNGIAIIAVSNGKFEPHFNELLKANVELKNITKQIVPEDFARNPTVQSYLLLKI